MKSTVLLTIPKGEASSLREFRLLAARKKRPVTQMLRAAMRLALAHPELIDEHVVAIQYGNPGVEQ